MPCAATNKNGSVAQFGKCLVTEGTKTGKEEKILSCLYVIECLTFPLSDPIPLAGVFHMGKPTPES